MNLWKMFGLKKTADKDRELINSLHNYWTHIKHPILGFMDRDDMHQMGIDDILHRLNVGKAPDFQGMEYTTHPTTGKPVPNFLPENLTPDKGIGKPFDTPPLNMVDLPPDLAHLHGKPSPLNRESLRQNLDDPKNWGMEEYFT